jgi:hypothetical protein
LEDESKHKAEAAAVIQSRYRGYACRKNLSKEREVETEKERAGREEKKKISNKNP